MGTRLTSFTLFWDGKYLGRGPGTERAADRCRALSSPSSPAWVTLVIHTAVAFCSLPNSKTFLEPGPGRGLRRKSQKSLPLRKAAYQDV